MKFRKTTYVAQLSEDDRALVKQRLENAGLDAEDVANGMDSRLSDLTDTIYIDDITGDEKPEDIGAIQKEMIELRKAHIRKEAPWILGD